MVPPMLVDAEQVLELVDDPVLGVSGPPRSSWRPARPQTLRAYSVTAHWKP